MSLQNISFWQDIIYHLVNTCDSLEQALADHDAADLEEDDAFIAHLDSQIFRCECCSWWYPVSEASQTVDGNCTDCVPEDED